MADLQVEIPDNDFPTVKRPIGTWFYSAMLLILGGLHLGFASVLLFAAGGAKGNDFWSAMLLVCLYLLAGSVLGALGLALWRGAQYAWWLGCCFFGGGMIFMTGVCVYWLVTNLLSDEGFSQYDVPWGTTVLMIMIFLYLYFNEHVRTFYRAIRFETTALKCKFALGWLGGACTTACLYVLIAVLPSMLFSPQVSSTANGSPALLGIGTKPEEADTPSESDGSDPEPSTAPEDTNGKKDE